MKRATRSRLLDGPAPRSTRRTETYQKAVAGLENAEGFLKGKSGRKPIATVAREDVQMAEDSRIITVKKIEQEQLANEAKPEATNSITFEIDTG